MKILMIIFMFLIIGALFIVANNNLAISNKENVEKFSELYSQWVNSLYSNSQKLSGEVVKLDWIPK